MTLSLHIPRFSQENLFPFLSSFAITSEITEKEKLHAASVIKKIKKFQDKNKKEKEEREEDKTKEDNSSLKRPILSLPKKTQEIDKVIEKTSEFKG